MATDSTTNKSGRWGGIRTHEGREPLPVFKTGAFNHSATHPQSAYNRPAGEAPQPDIRESDNGYYEKET